jgi:hypothetical protein
LETLFQTMKELHRRKASLKVPLNPAGALGDDDGALGGSKGFGSIRPRLRRAESVSKCMGCGQPFSMMRKRHNCRACGNVFCSRCSGQRFPLPFEPGKLSRICGGCLNRLILEQQQHLASPSLSTSEHNGSKSGQAEGVEDDEDDDDDRSKGVLEVGMHEHDHHSYVTVIDSHVSL